MQQQLAAWGPDISRVQQATACWESQQFRRSKCPKDSCLSHSAGQRMLTRAGVLCLAGPEQRPPGEVLRRQPRRRRVPVSRGMLDMHPTLHHIISSACQCGGCKHTEQPACAIALRCLSPSHPPLSWLTQLCWGTVIPPWVHVVKWCTLCTCVELLHVLSHRQEHTCGSS